MKVSIIGQGYVGLPLALALAEADIEVVGLDSNANRVEEIRLGISKVETTSQETLLRSLRNGQYIPTADPNLISDSDVYVITVPTPIDGQNKPDLSFLEAATRTISKYAKEQSLIINESTSFPGTLRRFIAPIFDDHQSGRSRNLHFASSPERIDPSNVKFNLFNTPRLVGGLTEVATAKAHDFYKKFVDNVITVSSAEVAEASKLLENTYRLINISFINEFAEYCAKKNINVREVIEAANSKPFGFASFYPSAGIGGHCIPVDPHYLSQDAEEVNVHLKVTQSALESNLQRSSRIVKHLNELGIMPPSRILIEGVTYKANVSDIRESPSLRIYSDLVEAGYETAWHDPIYDLDISGTVRAKTDEKFDLILICVVHNATDLNELDARARKILDLTGQDNQKNYLIF